MKTLIDYFDYEVEFQPNGTFGSKLPDGTFNGMVGSLMRNETDIGGPLLVTEERNKAVEFSVPFSIFQYGLMSGTVETQKHPFLIFDIFELPVWLTLFASVVFMAAAATVVYYGFGGDERWFIRHLINSPSFRLLQLLWFAGPGLVCLYSYQGGIISAFAANKIKTKFESLDDLKQYQSAKAMALSGSAITRFFESLTNTPGKYEYVWNRMKDSTIQYDVPGSVPPWMDVINKGKACVVGESYHMKTRVGDRFFKTGKCGLRVSDIDLQSSYVALAFRKEYHNTDLVKKFNRGIF
ncbi:hypothetical protein JTE90_000451 [Oedothorax gibbosus]|uniref:Ionotropic glutamate receptor L-glutamate and glycine-binding domain-containing protein n=1 Tax=Oedothorax gibbosus TaxID=931172 RepID=A0AAV6UED2_9ARAC|nr:hypothetical protein JTE90_000451 [Oedothorax gibbosus]